MAFARQVADRILFIDHGRIVEDRDTNAFFTEPHSARAREFLSKILAKPGSVQPKKDLATQSVAKILQHDVT